MRSRLPSCTRIPITTPTEGSIESRRTVSADQGGMPLDRILPRTYPSGKRMDKMNLKNIFLGVFLVFFSSSAFADQDLSDEWSETCRDSSNTCVTSRGSSCSPAMSCGSGRMTHSSSVSCRDFGQTQTLCHRSYTCCFDPNAGLDSNVGDAWMVFARTRTPRSCHTYSGGGSSFDPNGREAAIASGHATNQRLCVSKGQELGKPVTYAPGSSSCEWKPTPNGRKMYWSCKVNGDCCWSKRR